MQIDLDYKPLKESYLTYFDLSISSYKDLQLDFKEGEIFSKNASRIDEKVFENKTKIFGKSI